MDSSNIIFGLLNISSALLFILISVPLVKQKDLGSPLICDQGPLGEPG